MAAMAKAQASNHLSNYSGGDGGVWVLMAPRAAARAAAAARAGPSTSGGGGEGGRCELAKGVDERVVVGTRAAASAI